MKNLKNALLLRQLYQQKQLGYAYTSLNIYKDEEFDLTLPNTLEKLKKQALECHLCTLSKSRQKVVFGEGSSHAELMIVGDSPSGSDDSSGKIFTGRTGEILTKMIENVLGLNREQVYITNLLKCKSLDEKTPSSVCTHSCYPYLLKEIELIKPKLIITFGALAYQYITHDDSSIEKIRGIAHTVDNYIVIPTYHPSYLLRNPSAKKDVMDDLLKIKELL